MANTLITTIKRYIGLSTDTKPTTDTPAGSTYWEHDTNILYKYNGSAWVPFHVGSLVLTGTIDLQQAAGAYDLFTATGATVYIEHFTLTLPATPDLTNDVNLTSIKVETDTTTVITLLSATAGAKANLIAGTSFIYAVPFPLPVGKKIRLTIAGGAADASTVCTTRAKYQGMVPAGYLL